MDALFGLAQRALPPRMHGEFLLGPHWLRSANHVWH